jgi:hypothetical protein
MTEVLDRSSGPSGSLPPSNELFAEEALRRLEKKRDFRGHLAAYVLVNAFLWLIWGVVYAAGGPWFPWPVFPLFGWGIGLTFHAWDTYGRRPFSAEQVAETSVQWAWIAGGLVFSFLVPFVLADRLGLQRDLYYGVYVVLLGGFLAGWLRSTEVSLHQFVVHNWRRGLLLGLVFGAVLAAIALRTDKATSHPGGLRGVQGQRAPPAASRQDRDRRARARRLARGHRELPPRLQRLPLAEADEAADWRRPVERADPADAEPDRGSDRPRRAARDCGRPWLRHRSLPPAAYERGEDEMTLTRKDALATALTALAVLAFLATHEGWGVPLIGDSHRWAAGAITLLGVLTCGQGSLGKGLSTKLLATLGTVALVLAVLAIATGLLTPLSLLVADIVLLWTVSTARHILGIPQRPIAA